MNFKLRNTEPHPWVYPRIDGSRYKRDKDSWLPMRTNTLPLLAARMLQQATAHPCRESLPNSTKTSETHHQERSHESTRAKRPRFIYIHETCLIQWGWVRLVRDAWQQQDLSRDRTRTTVYHASISIYTQNNFSLKKKKYKTCLGINTRYKMQKKTRKHRTKKI